MIEADTFPNLVIRNYQVAKSAASRADVAIRLGCGQCNLYMDHAAKARDHGQNLAQVKDFGDELDEVLVAVVKHENMNAFVTAMSRKFSVGVVDSDAEGTTRMLFFIPRQPGMVDVSAEDDEL